MKVEIKEANQVKEREFPKLMKTESGKIVLMYSSNKHTGTGVLLKKDRGCTLPDFDFSREWAIEDFSDFDGSITISND